MLVYWAIINIIEIALLDSLIIAFIVQNPTQSLSVFLDVMAQLFIHRIYLTLNISENQVSFSNLESLICSLISQPWRL